MHRFIILLFPFFLIAQIHQPKQTLEEKFRLIPKTEYLKDYMKRLTARPHHIGAPYGKENAEWILAKFKEWGWDAKIETYQVLFPTPKERLVELIAPIRFSAKLQEPAVNQDPTSNQQQEQLPTYNAYSIDGDVTAPLVYVNYGTLADYEQLERMGISVKDCIVISRYGGSWRGIKPKIAAEHGAVGCIIYSDPTDDGYGEGEVFPNGPFRNSDGVQRGSVMDMPLHPGDPLTPGIGAKSNSLPDNISSVDVVTKIPVLPISYGDAQPLLAALNGPVAPSAWRGKLPITYHVGPGASKVHLKLLFDWKIVPIYNVIATMKGNIYPDEWIIRGNHHDAWVNGAEDPISGLISLLEEARALGELKKQGWKTKRTIVYCAWDGEEEGSLGSTEWAEDHAEELLQKAALYINTDANGRGYLDVSGSHTLENFVNTVAADITDPETNFSVWKRMQARQIVDAANEKDRNEIRSNADLKIDALGSGSDYTVFIDHLGIPSLSFGFGGEDDGGIYHSIYDDFYWYTKFSDTSFVYAKALAHMVGTSILRFADADVLPYTFTNFAETVKKYSEEVQTLLKTKQEEIKERNRRIDDGIFTAIADPKVKFIIPQKESVPPFLNFAPLQNAIDKLSQSAQGFAQKKQLGISKEKIAVVNKLLIFIERAMTSSDGLPHRPWFKNQIYAPGFYTGYGVKTLPAIREAIEQKDWKLVETSIVNVANVLERTAAAIDAASKEF